MGVQKKRASPSREGRQTRKEGEEYDYPAVQPVEKTPLRESLTKSRVSLEGDFVSSGKRENEGLSKTVNRALRSSTQIPGEKSGCALLKATRVTGSCSGSKRIRGPRGMQPQTESTKRTKKEESFKP